MKVPIPTKLVSRSTRMEFFCEFKVTASLNGRADKKGMKNLLNQVAPKRVLILRAGQSDEKLVKEMRDLGKECLYYLPKVEQSVFFDERSDRIKLMIPQSLLPSTVKLVRGADDLNCSVFTLAGSAAPLKYSVLDGVRLLRFMGKVEAPTAQVPQVYRDLKSIATADDDVAGVEESLVPATDEQEGDIEIGVLEEDPTEVSLLQELAAADNDTSAPSLQFEDIGLGAVSVGEVQLKALKGALEARGVPVEFRLGLGLVCGAQVIIRKDNENDFILEGPPSTTFFEARKILYEQFALI